ncbi:MAG: SMP-30/gluconolactonase/LRE family protein [Pirellulales bacterium]|nr:SMP-30/gluconolactonase/LRE family protein [Pirellulales bacterium]
MSEIRVNRVLEVRANLGEGPIWDADAKVLWWLDILGKKLHQFHPDSGRDETWDLGQMPGTVVCRQKGGVVLAVEDGFAEFDFKAEKLIALANPEHDKPENRFNDGKCDPSGRFWAGTMHKVDALTKSSGALYSLDADHRVAKHVDSVGVSNGIVWTQDAKTMYYIDTVSAAVDAFDFDNGAGKVSRRRTVFQVPQGMGLPDGMAIDDSGKLWVSFWDGWQVARICPIEGKVIGKIELPVANVTACAFGGAALDQLFITTARAGVSDEDLEKQPLAGDLFMAQPGVHGVVSAKFAG